MWLHLSKSQANNPILADRNPLNERVPYSTSRYDFYHLVLLLLLILLIVTCIRCCGRCGFWCWGCLGLKKVDVNIHIHTSGQDYWPLLLMLLQLQRLHCELLANAHMLQSNSQKTVLSWQDCLHIRCFWLGTASSCCTCCAGSINL